MSCGVGRRQGSDLALVWLWRRPAATVPIQPLAWESPYAAGAALKKKKKKKKRPQKNCKSKTQKDQMFPSKVLHPRTKLNYNTVKLKHSAQKVKVECLESRENLPGMQRCKKIIGMMRKKPIP